jgi:hypothetical protein
MTPFDVTFTDEEKRDLEHAICRDIEDALSARSSVIGTGGLIDLCDWFYEQGRTDPQDRPFPGAADLTSYFITEKVDALRARLMKAIFGVKPFCFVEGWGPDAQKAPAVEEFHDWQARRSGLKAALANTIHGALIEDGYILEVSERVETRRIVEELDVALQLNDAQAPVFIDGEPQIQSDDAGEPIPAQPAQAAATIKRDYVKTKRLGPQYDAISLKDFVFLPGHAKSQQQVWGYAYRVFLRIPEMQERAKDGIYDADAVTRIGESRDRDSAALPPTVDTVAYQEGPTVENELFQVSLKRDLDGDGREEWYILTVHLPTRTLLRCKLDRLAIKVGRARCVPFMLFPRRNSVYGYSYAADKIMTLAEEHTALRNMKADRGNLATNAPISRLRTAHWDPNAQPIGVGRVIDVNEHSEIKPFLIPDVPQSAVEQTMELIQAVERVSGLADSAVGVLSQETRTLGEQRLVAGGSAVRVDEVMGHLHAAISEVMRLTNAIWAETLKADAKGLDAPQGVVQSLQYRGQKLQDGKFTGDLLEGNFHFEPYGSDATAGPERRKQNLNQGLMTLTNLAKVVTPLQPIFQSVEFAKSVLEQWMQEYGWRDRQALMQAFQQPPAMPVQASPSGGPPMMGPPGAGAPPPGGPPMGGPGPQLPPTLLAMLSQGGGVPGVQ